MGSDSGKLSLSLYPYTYFGKDACKILLDADYARRRMLQLTPCDAEVSSPSAVQFFSRECTDNKLIPQKDPVQFHKKLSHVATPLSSRALRVFLCTVLGCEGPKALLDQWRCSS